jgi:hypothetical protein
MQYLKQIVTAINTSIAAKLTDVRFDGADYNGIVTYANKDGKLMPLVTDSYDIDKYIGIDDTFPLRVYHRNNGMSYTDEPAKSYGSDGNTSKKEIANMSAIIYGSRSILRLTAEELEGAIMSGMPSAIADSTLSQLKIKSCLVRPVSSVLDPVINYATEYRTNEFPLGPNALFIRLNYTIESSYKNACFNICDC